MYRQLVGSTYTEHIKKPHIDCDALYDKDIYENY